MSLRTAGPSVHVLPLATIRTRTGPTSGLCARSEGGQSRSAQILLRYPAGDWNALRRDLLDDLVFSLQVVVGLDEYGTDYTGGEFRLVERRSRAQSGGTSTVLPQGHGLIFTTRDRPVRTACGWSAATP